MNVKAWAPLLIAVVLGLIAAKVASNMAAKNKAEQAAVPKTANVVVMRNQLQPGQTIREEDVTVSPLATEHAPDGSFTDTKEVVGRVTASMMVKGQPVLNALLTQKGTNSGFQAIVPDGMRAITMDVNEASSVAGLITPGCRVDILASLNDAKSGSIISKTIVQNVKVMALGQRISNAPPPTGPDGKPAEGAQPPEQFRTVTMFVTPEEAEAIELASISGRPRLVLRGSNDTTPSAAPGMTIQELIGNPKAQPASTTPQPVALVKPTTRPIASAEEEEQNTRQITVIRGSAETTVNIKIKPSKSDQQTGTSKEQELVDPFQK